MLQSFLQVEFSADYVRGLIRKVLAWCIREGKSENPTYGLTYHYNRNRNRINALYQPVLQLVWPFKIELSILVLKELIDRLHDTFIASKTSTTKLGFQFRKQVEVKGDPGRRIWGMGKPSQLGMCELVHCRAGAEHIKSVLLLLRAISGRRRLMSA
jgi:hypothetical protein